MAEDENNRIQMEFLEVCSFGDLEQVIAMLANSKIDTNFRHHINKWTALHWASRRNHEDVVALLLKAGFDPYSTAKDGKTPLDLATSEAVKQIFMNHINSSKVIQATSASGIKLLAENHTDKKKEQEKKVCKNKDTLPRSRQAAKTLNFVAVEMDTDAYPNQLKHEIRSCSQPSSLRHVHFLLVRPSAEDGKEGFKRIALPGCSSIDDLKFTIEETMKKGKVLEVIMLPNRIKIETDQQVKDLTDQQKVEVVFDLAGTDKNLSVDDGNKNGFSKCGSLLKRKSATTTTEYSNEPESYLRSTDNVISLNDDGNSTSVADPNTRKNDDSNLMSLEEQLIRVKTPEIAVTSEHLLTAHSSISTIDTIFPSKILAKEMVDLQAVSLEKNKTECTTDESVLVNELATNLQTPSLKIKDDYEIAEQETETEGDTTVLDAVVDNSVVYDIMKSNDFAAEQVDDHLLAKEDWDRIIIRNDSNKRKLQIALLIGCIVGFGGLTYMFYKK
uniref:ANK_REP_REGION domain-containing protein n=1 Tax=Setaria digitata TaxID=48799 RepID=A0A915PNS1_9BILA